MTTAHEGLKMVIWRIRGNEIGPNDCGAYYFTTKGEADEYIRSLDDETEEGVENILNIAGPEKITIKNREQLVKALNEAMGFGGA